MRKFSPCYFALLVFARGVCYIGGQYRSSTGGKGMLGENLKKLRKEKGMSQQEVAQRLHVVRQTVSKWESGVSQS